MSYKTQQAVEDFRSGKIDEWDLKRELQRDYGDCSCMSRSIDRIIRDVDYGIKDGYDADRDLRRDSYSCERED